MEKREVGKILMVIIRKKIKVNIHFQLAAMESCRFLRYCRSSPALSWKRLLFPPPSTLSFPFSLAMSTHTAGRSSSALAYEALLLDAGGTLLELAEPVEDTYASIGRKYGVNATRSVIKRGFKRAFSAPWSGNLRYQGDGRPFWKLVVSEATGCSREDYFEEVYEYFAKGDAWKLPVGAYETMQQLKLAGVRLAVVSNFDTRLRKLLKDLNVDDLFDAIIVSSEVGYEKPDTGIFKVALDQIRVEASKAVHVGDDEKADKVGANSMGIECWLWGTDLKTFAEIQKRIIMPNE